MPSTLHGNALRAQLVAVVCAQAVVVGGHVRAAERDRSALPADQPRGCPNLFVELLDVTPAASRAKIDAAWRQLFYGDDDNQRVYFPVAPDKAFVLDVHHNDVRSEGMSYGMMICLQLDRQEEFNRLWRWAVAHMQHKDQPRRGYFAWQVATDGRIIDPNSASDGEEWFATALLLASARWGDGAGIFDYDAQAQRLLRDMLDKRGRAEDGRALSPLFDPVEKQVVFVPIAEANHLTDPSYHLPHFYELWADRAENNGAFWQEAAATSRQFLQRACHPRTGLAPDYARFDGTPIDPWGQGHDAFRFDAWRVAANVAVDHAWCGPHDWAQRLCDRLLEFFHSEGLDAYANQYALDGRPLSNDRSSGLQAMNAVAAIAATTPRRIDFVQALWDMPIPQGEYRYYDGMLYMLALLQAGGQFQMY